MNKHKITCYYIDYIKDLSILLQIILDMEIICFIKKFIHNAEFQAYNERIAGGNNNCFSFPNDTGIQWFDDNIVEVMIFSFEIAL